MDTTGSSSNSAPSEPASPRVAAFFDMDKTLISENSGSLYMQHLYGKGEIGLADLAVGLGDYLRYKVGMLDLEAWVQGMAAPLAGRSEPSVVEEAREWFEECVVEKIYPEALARVVDHRDAGDLVAIVSGAANFVIEPLAERLEIEHVISTRFEVLDGVFTGRVIEPACFEHGKVHWLIDFVARHGIDLAKSWFYTDSVTDLPLLERVGHPVITNPDPLLYWTARRRQWPVLFFEPPPAENS